MNNEFKILGGDRQYGTHQYLVDEEGDLEDLPVAEVGSVALVAATSDVYILNNKMKWIKL